MQTDWNPILRQEFNKPYWVKLQNYILDQRESHMVFPAHPDVLERPYETHVDQEYNFEALPSMAC